MSRLHYKRKITESLNTMTSGELKEAWLVFKEIATAKKIPLIHDKKDLEKKLSEGIQQLDNGEGSDFGSFLNGLKKKYANG